MKRFLLIGLLALTACGVAPEVAQPTTPAIDAPTAELVAVCDPTDFIKQIEPLSREWSDTVTLAQKTPRAALSGQISALQALQRRAESIETPDCATSTKEALISQMSITNRAFLGFLGEQGSGATDDLFALAGEQQSIFAANLPLLKANQPIPETPTLFTDGLKVSRDALVKPLDGMGLIFPQHMGATETQMTADSRDDSTTVTFVGTADNVRATFIVGQAKKKDETQEREIIKILHAHIQSALPDWKEADAWLTGVLGKPGPQTIVNRGRIVHYERSFDSNPIWKLQVRVP